MHRHEERQTDFECQPYDEKNFNRDEIPEHVRSVLWLQLRLHQTITKGFITLERKSQY